VKNALPYLLVGVLGLGLLIVLGYAAFRGIESLAEDMEDPYPYEAEAEGDEVLELFPAGEAAAITTLPPPPSLLAPYPPSLAAYALERDIYMPVWLFRERLAIGDARAREALSLLLRETASREDADATLPALLDIRGSLAHCAWLRRETEARELRVGRAHLLLDLVDCEDRESVEIVERDPEALPEPERTLIIDRMRIDASIEDRVRDPQQPLVVLADRIAEEERDRLSRALVRCVADHEKVGSAHALECLRVLAKQERALAVATARTLVGQELPDALFEEEAVGLLEWESAEAALDDLTRRGLVGLEPMPADAPPRTSARGLLETLGRAHSFEPPRGASDAPPLLVRLAHLARPTLDDVVFEIPDGPPATPGAAYRVAAYLDGVEVSVWSSGVSPTANLYAIIALLARVLEMRGESRRFVALEPGDSVAYGPREALVALEEDGLVFLQPLAYYGVEPVDPDVQE
jgi:hypothetical protein